MLIPVKVLALAFLLPFACFGAAVSITDTLTRPDGTTFTGRLVIDNQQMTSAEGVTIVRAQRTVIVTNGVLSISLEANTGATPAGTSYTVRYLGDDGVNYEEFWVVPATGPVEVNEIRVATIPTPAIEILLTQLAQGGATTGEILAWNGTEWAPAADAGGGITSLNGETGATQLFARVNDTNVTLTVASSGGTHTFTMGWTGLLALSRGGTGADLSATGGANQFVKQSSAGGALSVGAIADADVPDNITIDNAVTADALAANPAALTTGAYCADLNADGSCATEATPVSDGAANQTAYYSDTNTLSGVDALVYNAALYGVVANGSDESTDFLALLDIVHDAGGGTIHLNPGTTRINSQVLLPNDGSNNQNNIRITCSGGGGVWTGTNACVLDLRYAGNLGAKIETLAKGMLQIDNLTITDGGAETTYSVTGGGLTDIVVTSNTAVATFASTIPGGAFVGATWKVSGSTTAELNGTYNLSAVTADTLTFTTVGVADATYNNSALTMGYSAAFLHSASTTLYVHGNTFIGNTTSTTQDAIVLGGRSTAVDGTLNAAFQGYQTRILANHFRSLNRWVFGRTYANAVMIRNNSSLAERGTVAIEFDNGVQDCNSSRITTGLFVDGNLIEMANGYIYGVKLNCVKKSFFNNAFYDENSSFVASDYFLTNLSSFNTIILQQSDLVSGLYVSGAATSLSSLSIFGGTPIGELFGFTSQMSNKSGGGHLVSGQYNAAKDYPGPFEVIDAFTPALHLTIAANVENGNTWIDATQEGCCNRRIRLNGSGGDVLMGGGAFHLSPVTFANLGSLNFTSLVDGMTVYCSDCQNSVDDAAPVGSVAAGSGSGAGVMRVNSSWRTMN